METSSKAQSSTNWMKRVCVVLEPVLQSALPSKPGVSQAITVTAISHAPGTLLFMPNISMAVAQGVMAKYQCFVSRKPRRLV